MSQKSLEEIIRMQMQRGRDMNHVFVSYVREDLNAVMRLKKEFEDSGIKVWLDRERLQPGVRWEKAIVEAIKNGIYFVACFSENQSAREKSYQRKEIRLALKEMELMAEDRIWFIPVKLTKCDLPHFVSDAQISLESLQWIDLSEGWREGVDRVIDIILSKTK